MVDDVGFLGDLRIAPRMQVPGHKPRLGSHQSLRSSSVDTLNYDFADILEIAIEQANV